MSLGDDEVGAIVQEAAEFVEEGGIERSGFQGGEFFEGLLDGIEFGYGGILAEEAEEGTG